MKCSRVVLVFFLTACGGSETGPLGQRMNGTVMEDTCQPNEALCDGRDIVRCGDDGLSTDVIKSCDAGAVCGWCGLLPSCTPPPTCSGNTDGLPNDVVFSNACDAAVTCGAAFTERSASVTFDVPGHGIWSFDVDEFPSGVSQPVNATVTNTHVSFRAASGYELINYSIDNAPRPGTLRYTYTSLSPGSEVLIELDAPIYDWIDHVGPLHWVDVKATFRIVL